MFSIFCLKGWGLSLDDCVPAGSRARHVHELLSCQEEFLQQDALNQENFHRETVNAVAAVHREAWAPC